MQPYRSVWICVVLMCSRPRRKKDISGEKVSPASRYHTATAHTVLTALIRWVQLPQLMLSDLPYQCVEGVLDSLSTDKRRNVTERHIQRSIRSGVHCAHLSGVLRIGRLGNIAMATLIIADTVNKIIILTKKKSALSSCILFSLNGRLVAGSVLNVS